MRINIDKLQSQKLLSEVDRTVVDKIIGGDSIAASVNVIAYTSNAKAQASAGVFAFDPQPFGRLEVGAETREENGSIFSKSSSFAFSTSG